MTSHELMEVSWLLCHILALSVGNTASNPLHCKPTICHPCFSADVTCVSKNESEIIPQHLDEGIQLLNLTFTSPNASTVQFHQKYIQRYKSIRKLRLSGDFDSIEWNALSSLTDLTSLHIVLTYIKHLPDQLLAKNTKLNELVLLDNLLNEIPLNIFIGLTSINVGSFTFSKHRNVTLPCYNRSLSLPYFFYNLKILKTLDLSFNNFYNPSCSAISGNFFKPVRQVTRLDIGETNFIHTNPHALMTLIDLHQISLNSLAPYKYCPSTIGNLLRNLPSYMKTVTIASWQVSSKLEEKCFLDKKALQGLSRVKWLKSLRISDGDGIFGPILYRTTIPKLSKLRILDLSGCRINFIEEDAFTGYPQLTTLILDGNSLGAKDLKLVSQPLSTLKLLSLSYTSIRAGDDFQYRISNALCDFPNLTTIRLTSNALEQLPVIVGNESLCNFSTHLNLSNLVAKHNSIKQFASGENGQDNICKTITRLKSLILSFNQLKDLQGLEFCTDLEILQLDHNSLVNFDPPLMAKIFYSLRQVKHLSLSYNNLLRVDVELISQMPKLNTFDASFNNIVSIGTCFFKNNPELKIINLRQNFLQFIEPSFFVGLMHLELLNLEENKFPSFTHDFLTAADRLHLSFFGIKNNPFDCDCDKKYFQNWLHDNLELEKYSIHYMNCSSPANQRGKLVYEYEDDVFDCVVKDILQYGSIITGGFFLAVAIALPCYKYRWHFKHIKIIWKAFVGSLSIVKLEHVCHYDAYISFDSKNEEDSIWVAEELIPALEECQGSIGLSSASTSSSVPEQKSLRLYLEPRDSLPGSKRFTQRQMALKSSKRVLLVLSNSYLRSPDCLGEANLSGFKLYEEKFHQANRVLALIREELSEEIIRPPMTSLLLGKILKVETVQQRKELMWRKIRSFLSKPLYIYYNADKVKGHFSKSDSDSETPSDDDSDVDSL